MACVLDEVTEMITENDHRASLCLCKECTCGKHVCPYRWRSSAVPKSSYKTRYHYDYPKHPIRPSSAQSGRSYKQSQFKLENTTTSKQDYVAIDVSVNRNHSFAPVQVHRPQKGLKYHSQYQYEYQDWKDFLQSPQKPLQKAPPVTGKFTANTTYSVCFENKGTNPVKPIIQDGNGNPVALGYEQAINSTHRTSYRGKSADRATPIKLKDNTLMMKCQKGHFRSTCQQEFVPPVLASPMRRARKNAFSK